jgi:hypothetical protein
MSWQFQLLVFAAFIATALSREQRELGRDEVGEAIKKFQEAHEPIKHTMPAYHESKTLAKDADYYIRDGDYKWTVYVFHGKTPNLQLEDAARKAADHFNSRIGFVTSPIVTVDDADLVKELKNKKDRIQSIEDFNARRKSILRFMRVNTFFNNTEWHDPTSEQVVVVAFDRTKKNRYVYPITEAAPTEDELIRWVGGVFISRQIEPVLLSAPLPDSEDEIVNGVHVSVGSTFSGVSADQSKDVVFYSFRNRCHTCNAFTPIVEEIAKYFQDNDSVLFTKMESSANDAAGFAYTAFPSLRIFSRYNKTAEGVELQFDRSSLEGREEETKDTVIELIQKERLSGLAGELEALQSQKRQAVEAEDYDVAKVGLRL